MLLQYSVLVMYSVLYSVNGNKSWQTHLKSYLTHALFVLKIYFNFNVKQTVVALANNISVLSVTKFRTSSFHLWDASSHSK